MKKTSILRAGKLLAWLAGFLVILSAVTAVLQPKYYFATVGSPETEIWGSFYEQPEDSIDLIFLGSSHVYNGFNPAQFYEETGGITSFALSSSRQDFPTSYFYLKEALRYQSPRYVILEVYGATRQGLTETACYKRSLDNMRWSSVKLEAVQAWLENLNSNETLLPRLLTLIDYHSRWDALKQSDYNDSHVNNCINGYVPHFGTSSQTFEGYEITEDTIPLSIEEINLSYFYRIIDLCKEEGITLMLAGVPDTAFSASTGLAMYQLAEEEGLLFLDYNAASQCERLDLNGSTDFRNASHLNYRGAEKFTKVLAEDLLASGVTPGAHDQDQTDYWSSVQLSWTQQRIRRELVNTSDVLGYLEKLGNNDFIVLCASQDSFTGGMTDEIRQALAALGAPVPEDLSSKSSWAFICQGGTKLDAAKKLRHGTAAAGLKAYDLSLRVKAANTASDTDCSIVINDVEYALKEDGLNFVIYSIGQEKVIDCVCFDLEGDCTAER